MPDREVGEESIGLGDQCLGAGLRCGIGGEEVLPVQMREPVVAIQGAQADGPLDLSADGIDALGARGAVISIAHRHARRTRSERPGPS